MGKYLMGLYCEHVFCSYFSLNHIDELSLPIYPDYVNLILNIYEFVLITAIVSSLLQKNIQKLDITEADIKRLEEQFKDIEKSQFKMLITEHLEQIIWQFHIDDIAVQTYLMQSIASNRSKIYEAIKGNYLQKFVLVQPEKSSILSYHFDFGMEMNRDDYRELIAEIEYCQHEQDKLSLILENIHTLSDIDKILIDVKLADETIILILNKITEEEFIALLANYLIYEDEMHQIAQILFNYLETFDYEKQKRIRQKALHIQGEFITCNSKK